MTRFTLKYLIETINGDHQRPVSKEEKQAFKEAVANFSAMGESVYGKTNLHELTERVRNIVEMAQRVVTEDADWFNEIAHKKNFKRLEEDYRMFEDTAKEMAQLQERLNMAYENIGKGLDSYFDVN